LTDIRGSVISDEDSECTVLVALNPEDWHMGHPDLPGSLEAVVPRKDVVGATLGYDGAKPAILLNAGDNCADITLTCIFRVELEFVDLNIFNKR
jgi:hypothetical protein